MVFAAKREKAMIPHAQSNRVSNVVESLNKFDILEHPLEKKIKQVVKLYSLLYIHGGQYVRTDDKSGWARRGLISCRFFTLIR